ncbi:hypothetical protein Phep_3486 [Pedobacter heparinus DSM 2366]|uniref:Uncharacterized protein n=1 Tax=Pedobacter heparinus (strain ATCC 13125 / DSM 2366 / CIP 104194 / JCM 7457 / NBRC 12017 / NCIMB 9290 / NRRL B-14731 / HIM 762-3) TaxID=485917 RepID=C6XTA0_PEDHD|nr:hypothetical protein [Pedobacter sp. AK017]ACU05678.1 hypothetical protein Phep_3486 [Pedobacter heparinus DSM 2366]
MSQDVFNFNPIINRKKNLEDTIKGLVPHVLSFIVSEYCKYGFLLAYEKDLSDLKGLIEPDSIAAEDFELLEAVDDEVVQLLLNSIDKVINCSKTFFMINNLDEFEVMENEEYNQLASDNYYIYIIDWENKDYNDVLINLNAVYFTIARLLYHTASQLRLKEIELPDEFYDDEFLDKYSDLLDHKVIANDKNVALLYDLIADLNADLLDIDRLS